MTDARGLAIVGATVAAPMLLGAVVRAGVPIPAYVTDAHRAALAELARASVTGGDQANHRYLDFNRARLASRGPAPGKPHLANLTADDLDALCEAFLAAARVGVTYDGELPYEVVPNQTIAYKNAGLVEALWNTLDDDADGRELTPLGNAVARVMRIRAGIASGFLSSPEDMLSGNLAVGQLAIEMDDQGYLITGKPETKTLLGGFQAAGSAVAAFAADASADAAKAAALAVWALLKDSPLLLAGVGLVAWKVLR